jgi:hypothetical protein
VRNALQARDARAEWLLFSVSKVSKGSQFAVRQPSALTLPFKSNPNFYN